MEESATCHELAARKKGPSLHMSGGTRRRQNRQGPHLHASGVAAEEVGRLTAAAAFLGERKVALRVRDRAGQQGWIQALHRH